jgi:hypothetical protein
MTALSVQPPYPIFTDIDGQPLENGYVWIGAVNLDPQTNPIAVYWDAGLTIAAAQPIRTLAGYPSNNGTPARIYTGSDYSIRVQNKNGSVVYSAPTATESYSSVVIPNFDPDGRFRAPAFIAGTEQLSGAALRDSYVVGRNLNGLTDCHAFADRTIIDDVTDAGTYGTFDATTELYGAHTQNHVYAFQDRVRYRGTGTLQNSTGFYSSTVHSGSGTVDSRIGMMIDPMVKTGGGTISSQVGILINPLTTGANNVAINAGQTTGWTLYAAGGAKSYHGGQLGVGSEPIAGAKLYVTPDTFGNLAIGIRVVQPNAWSMYCTGAGKMYHQGEAGFGVEPSVGAIDFSQSGGSTGFLTTNASTVTLGAVGDKTIRFVTGGDERLLLDATTYTFKPAFNNLQKLGDAGFRWTEVFATNGTINTSDAREKQAISELSAAEKAVAQRIKSLIRTFKFNEAVQRKEDGARIHVGVVAQDIKAAFEAEGIDPHKYGIFCYDEWSEVSEEIEALQGEDGAYPKQVEIQKTEVVFVTQTKTEVVGDKAILISYTEEISRPAYKSIPLFDERGNRVRLMVSPQTPAIFDNDGSIAREAQEAVYQDAFHKIPDNEVVTRFYKKKIKKEAGNIYGIRYEELLCFVVSVL